MICAENFEMGLMTVTSILVGTLSAKKVRTQLPSDKWELRFNAKKETGRKAGSRD